MKQQMGPAEKKIADYILQNSNDIISTSISEFAEKCGCGDATVVRFARRLGFDGYQKPGTGEWKTTGIPFQMIARVFESGSVKNGYQWRRPTHFARRAVQSKREAAQTAMKNAADAAMQKIKQQKGV